MRPMLRYSLSTLMIVAGIAPPAIALFWFGWRGILVLAAFILLLYLWVRASLGMARFFAWLIASVMD
jgi:hypothetical protein